LAPDDDKPTMTTGSAWGIVVKNAFPEGNDWAPENPSPSSTDPHPMWTLVPANTNQGIIGTGDSANITFAFTNIISITPPGYTQMVVMFSGFMKDDTTAYNDAVFVLDIISFFSSTALYSVTLPTQAIQISLRWTTMDVASVILIVAFPGIQPTRITYSNPPEIGYYSAQITIPGTTQSVGIPLTLQAYDGNGGYLNSMQFTAYIQANMFVDARDGQVYPTIQVNDLIWMAQNLNYQAPTGSSYYGNSSQYEVPYGQLYSLDSAQANIPSGWRLPTQDDWNDLFSGFPTPQAAYAALIAGGSIGFVAQLGGFTDNDNNSSNLGTYGYYWSSTSTSQSSGQNYCAEFSGQSQRVSTLPALAAVYQLSVRYVRDAS